MTSGYMSFESGDDLVNRYYVNCMVYNFIFCLFDNPTQIKVIMFFPGYFYIKVYGTIKICDYKYYNYIIK